MLSIVIYDSKFGNTEKIAQAIAAGAASVGSVRVMSVGEVTEPFVERPDLLFIGGPTQRHGMSPGLRSFLDALPRSLAAAPTATFDTRYRQAQWLSGSAAAEAAKRIRQAGGRMAADPQSFFMSRAEAKLEAQTLEAGELERAQVWGRTVGSAAANQRLVTANA